MHTKLLKEIMQSTNADAKEYLEHMVIEMIDNVKHVDFDKYLQIEHKLYEYIHGEHLNSELASKWVSHMDNKDGTKGPHWPIEQTNSYAGNHDRWDWYVAMNMAYSDFYNQKFSTSDYVDLANGILDDVDAPEDKLLRYYFYIVCKDKKG